MNVFMSCRVRMGAALALALLSSFSFASSALAERRSPGSCGTMGCDAPILAIDVLSVALQDADVRALIETREIDSVVRADTEFAKRFQIVASEVPFCVSVEFADFPLIVGGKRTVPVGSRHALVTARSGDCQR